MLELIRAFSYRGCSIKDLLKGREFSDKVVVGELNKSPGEVEQAARGMDSKDLEEVNRSFDEYILRQMRFKSEIMDEIAR